MLRSRIFFVSLVAALLATAHADESKLSKLDGTALSTDKLDPEVARLMAKAQVTGLAVALIENGQSVWVRTWGLREVEGAKPLQNDTIMYAASLTKLVFAYTVMQLVDEGVLQLDQPIASYFKKPLPEYPKYADLAGDDRWKKITPRMLLSHTAGFPNFRFVNADGKLDIKFEPGSRYAYSGEGINLLQFVLEQGLGLDLGKEMQHRVFDRFDMTRTSMTWREDFAGNLTQGYTLDGTLQPHSQRSSVRAAGSMDTTIADYAKFFAGYIRGDGLSPAAHQEMLRAQIGITSAHQFPTLDPKQDPDLTRRGLASVTGGVTVPGPRGALFWKGGHDDGTANLALALVGSGRGLVLMSNSVRAELIYPALAELIWGETGLPWDWEYNPGGMPPPVR